jgi:hypothetical protein
MAMPARLREIGLPRSFNTSRWPRMEAPDALVPRADVGKADALEALTSSRHELLALIVAADGWDGTQVTGRHPFFGTLDL